MTGNSRGGQTSDVVSSNELMPTGERVDTEVLRPILFPFELAGPKTK